MILFWGFFFLIWIDECVCSTCVPAPLNIELRVIKPKCYVTVKSSGFSGKIRCCIWILHLFNCCRSYCRQMCALFWFSEALDFIRSCFWTWALISLSQPCSGRMWFLFKSLTFLRLSLDSSVITLLFRLPHQPFMPILDPIFLHCHVSTFIMAHVHNCECDWKFCTEVNVKKATVTLWNRSHYIHCTMRVVHCCTITFNRNNTAPCWC